MPLVKGILSFPALFTPKTAKGATDPKYGVVVLLPPNDPQLPDLLALVEAAKLDAFPSGYTGTDECVKAYDIKYAGKDYYDPRFSGWYAFSSSSKQDDKPAVVDMNRQPVIDQSLVYSGCIAYVNAAISGYNKGKGGVGGWLNGVMVTDEVPLMGRLDGKPTVDQMFVNIGGNAGVVAPALAPYLPPASAPVPPPALAPIPPPHLSPAFVPVAPPALAPPVPVAPPVAPPVPVPPPHLSPALAPALAPVQLVMTAAANGVTYEQYMATAGWTDQMLIDQGLAILPSFA